MTDLPPATLDRAIGQLQAQADHLRAWINGYLSGLATAAALVIAVWILW